MTKYISLAALALSLALGGAAQAATATFTHDYGTVDGAAPIYGSGGTMAADHVKVLDTYDSAGNRFYDELDFTSLTGSTINSLTLTLQFADAPYQPFIIGSWQEWIVFGTTNGGTNPSDRSQIGGRLNSSGLATWEQLLVVGNVFDQAVSAGKMAFWFADEGGLVNTFKLYSASVTVDYTPAAAAVPLPAGGVLLVGALGGIAALRRRKAD